MDKSENWSHRLNKNLTSEEIMEEKFKYVIDVLIKNWKPGGQFFRMETSKGVEIGNEGMQSIHFGPFSKEEADFIEAKVVSELTEKETKPSKEETEPSKEENVKEDLVNHPKHYTSHPSGIETIEITRWMNFNLGNSVKYILRSGKKSEDTAVQDLEKAIWYLKDEIKRLKGEYDAK